MTSDFSSEEELQDSKPKKRGKGGKGKKRGGKGKKPGGKGKKRGKKVKKVEKGPAPPTDEQDKLGEGGGEPAKGGGVPVSCSLEKAMSAALGKSAGTTSIRAVFHDAMDQDNLLFKKDDGSWEPFTDAAYGGVDGCLYSPLSGGDKGYPNPDHNRNVPGALPRAVDVCKAVCWMVPKLKICQGKKVNIKGAKVAANCIVDATVLSANNMIRLSKGPDVTMLWGHEKGNCGQSIVTPFVKHLNPAIKAKFSKMPALRMAPSFTDIDNPKGFSDVFQRLGFNARDHVALMGAHTVGKIQPCASGLNGIEVGPWCKNQKKVIPPLPDNLIASPRGTCKLSATNSCFSVHPKTGAAFPIHSVQGKNTLRGFGDGGVWDRSPSVFDNDYFKLMADVPFDQKDLCCGGTKGGLCMRTGALYQRKGWKNKYPYKYTWKTGKECMFHSGRWNREIQPTKLIAPFDKSWISPKKKGKKCYTKDGRWAEAVEAGDEANYFQGVHPADLVLERVKSKTGPCENKFCRDDRKGRTHMKSMMLYKRVPAFMLKNARQHGNILRIVRLPGDWSILAGEETNQIVKEFASEVDGKEKFHSAFSDAWTKVINKTHSKLSACVGEVDQEQVAKFREQFKKRLGLTEMLNTDFDDEPEDADLDDQFEVVSLSELQDNANVTEEEEEEEKEEEEDVEYTVEDFQKDIEHDQGDATYDMAASDD